MLGCHVSIYERLGNIALWEPSSIPSLFAWYRARESDVTVSSGAVSQWRDSSGNGRHVSQATAGARPTWVASGGIGGGASIEFDGASDYLESEAASSLWKFLHDGTGFTVAVVFAVNTTSILSTFVSTCGISSVNESGTSLSVYSPTYNTFAMQVMNGSGSRAIDAEPAASTSGSMFGLYSYKELESPEYRIERNGTSIGSGNVALNPSSSNPSHTLRMGYNGGSYWLSGQVREIVICNDILSAGDKAKLNTYLASLL